MVNKMTTIELTDKELIHLEHALVTIQALFKQDKIISGDKNMVDTLQSIRNKYTLALLDAQDRLAGKLH